jgi:hypothetical protein
VLDQGDVFQEQSQRNLQLLEERFQDLNHKIETDHTATRSMLFQSIHSAETSSNDQHRATREEIRSQVTGELLSSCHESKYLSTYGVKYD